MESAGCKPLKISGAEENSDTEESERQQNREDQLTFSEYQSDSNAEISEHSDTTSNSPEEQAPYVNANGRPAFLVVHIKPNFSIKQGSTVSYIGVW